MLYLEVASQLENLLSTKLALYILLISALLVVCIATFYCEHFHFISYTTYVVAAFAETIIVVFYQ